MREHLGPEATLLRVAGQHLEQVAREQRRLVAARPGADLDQDVLVVVRVSLHRRQADLLAELIQPGGRVSDELASSGSSPSSAKSSLAPSRSSRTGVLARQLVRGLELPVLASDLGVALPVGDHRRVRHLPLQLREAGFDLLHEGSIISR